MSDPSMNQDIVALNARRAEELIAGLASPQLQHFINGRRCGSADGASFANHSPVDGRILCPVASGSAADIASAAQSAQEAFAQWRACTPARRRDILHAAAGAIENNAERIALVESADTGQPIRFTAKTAARGAENFRYFADRVAMAGDGHSFPAESHIHYTLREPIGAVGVITPWNMPFMLATWKIAPALAAGCTVVHKPAEWAPLTASLLAEICVEAGLPPGVLNVVHGLGESAGRALTEDPAIRAIAFVGDTATGSRIMGQGAATLKRVHFELGGKSPVLVFDDADLERALTAVSFMIFSLNGQRCNSGSRLLIQDSIHDAFVEKLIARAQSIRIGDPLDPATELGPLIHPVQYEKVSGHCRQARADGATLSGAALPSGLGEPGLWYPPTLVTNVTPQMKIAREEVFGPVLAVMKFRSEAEAVAIANDTRYGLSAYVWTGDSGRTHRLARSLQAGMVWVNTEISRHLATPFGGFKDSGIGRDGGDWSFEFYMETKNVCVALGTHHIPSIGRG